MNFKVQHFHFSGCCEQALHLLALELGEALLEDEASDVIADLDGLHGDLDALVVVHVAGLGALVLDVLVVNAATGMGTLAQAGQNMTLKDINALGSAGALTQGATQAQLDAAKAQFDAQQNYAKTMATWQGGQLGAGTVPTTTTGSTQTVVPTASPLSQLASGAALLAQ